MKLGWIDKAMGAAIAGSVFTMMESTSHSVSSVISAAFNAGASPEGRILAAGIALSGLAIEGYAAFLAGTWAAIGHSVSSRPDTIESDKATTLERKQLAHERISAFEQREKQARQLTAGGHVPSKDELDAFFNDGLQGWTAPTPRC
jgi:hypothetical protein